MDFRAALKQQFGLDTVDFHYNLDKAALFNEAIANDRGRVTKGGPDNAQKAFATKLGADGPLVFYTNPECTGRPVQDTFAVDHPEITDTVWWKQDFKKFDAGKFNALLDRVVAHLNDKQARLYVQDVFCGWDPAYSVPYRFVGEFATHAMFCTNMFADDVAVDDPQAFELASERGETPRELRHVGPVQAVHAVRPEDAALARERESLRVVEGGDARRRRGKQPRVGPRARPG